MKVSAKRGRTTAAGPGEGPATEEHIASATLWRAPGQGAPTTVPRSQVPR